MCESDRIYMYAVEGRTKGVVRGEKDKYLIYFFCVSYLVGDVFLCIPLSISALSVSIPSQISDNVSSMRVYKS